MDLNSVSLVSDALPEVPNLDAYVLAWMLWLKNFLTKNVVFCSLVGIFAKWLAAHTRWADDDKVVTMVFELAHFIRTFGGGSKTLSKTNPVKNKRKK